MLLGVLGVLDHGPSSSLQPTARPSRRRTATIVSFSTRIDDFQPSWNITKAFANRWGYSAELHTRPTLNASLFGGSPWTTAWEKMAIVAAALEDGHDAVAWIDDDAFVNKGELSVESWLATAPGADLLIGRNAERNASANPGPQALNMTLNTGVFIVRASPWSRRFFATFIQQCTQAERTQIACCPEQDCLARLLAEPENRPKLAAVALDSFNCHPSHPNFDSICDPWIYHSMGTGEKQYLVPAAKLREAHGRALTSQDIYGVEGLAKTAKSPSSPLPKELIAPAPPAPPGYALVTSTKKGYTYVRTHRRRVSADASPSHPAPTLDAAVLDAAIDAVLDEHEEDPTPMLDAAALDAAIDAVLDEHEDAPLEQLEK